MSTSDPGSRAWLEVSAPAIRKNARTVLDAMGTGADVIPMVKADGYGLGVEGVVRTLEPLDPFAYGVATVAEGIELRSLGVERRVLVFSPIPPGAYGAAVSGGLTVCLSDLDGLGELESAARGPTPFHVEIDTGMGRSGFDWRKVDAWGPELAARSSGALRWEGCFTHLRSADADEASVWTQYDRFREALDRLELPDACVVHVANSAGALRCGERLPPLARPGIFLFGGEAGGDLPAPEAVAALRARVLLVRDADPGTTVGYGATYRASGGERWATLGIGYGDGFPRVLGNRGEAVIRGRRVPIIGRISMDVTVVNISSVPGVERGDIATLIGRDGDERITVDQVAKASGTIAYEILTGLTARLPRIWEDSARRG